MKKTIFYGFLAVILALAFTACKDDEEDLKGWSSWTDTSATATIDISVDDDGVCTITIGGVAQVNNDSDGWGKWKAAANYSYHADENTQYEYKFEAWTQSGTRVLSVQYYNTWGDSDSEGVVKKFEDITLTSQRKTFTFDGEVLPRGGIRTLEFMGADQLGTFYVKVLSVTAK